MKITKVEIREKKFALRFPSAVSYATQETAPNVFIKLCTDAGMVGWGCCAPDEEVTGETPESVRDFLEQIAYPVLKGADPLERRPLLERLRMEGGGRHPSAHAAASIALFDLAGKAFGAPVFRLLGGVKKPLPTSYTISLLPLDEALEQVREALERGFRILKIKIGENPQMDAQRIAEIRKTAGPDIPFRLDANQAYSATDTLRLLDMIEHKGVEFIEQPTPGKDLSALKQVSDTLPIPVMADEPVLDAGDAFRIASKKMASLVNIKLMKCGGLDEAMDIDRVCAAAGISTMLGCMDESALSITAALHLAMVSPNVKYIDLDGHFDLIDDIASGAPIFKDGLLAINEKPGFGVDIEEP